MPMRRRESEFSSRLTAEAATHLGNLVRRARLARGWPLAALAERARLSLATVKRIEGGSVSVALGGWLAALEVVGLLPRLLELRDPVSDALLGQTEARRARRKAPSADLDF